MDVQLQETDHKGRAFVQVDGETKAEMTYSRAGTKLVIIDHTEVDASLQGKGVGRQLLMAIIEMVRAEESKILPLCPYAKSVFTKDDSIKDVLRA